MSLSRKNRLMQITGLLYDLVGKGRREKKNGVKSPKLRRLMIDQLEDRQLLSLTVSTTADILVNPEWQDIRGDHSVTTNSSGDVVVTWAAADRLLNPDYDATDPNSSYYLEDENGNYVEDLNIYARYLTDEVQLLTIPEELIPGTTTETGKSANGTIELLYKPSEVQRLSFYSAYEPFSGTSNLIEGSIDIGLFVEGTLTWKTYEYNEMLTPSDNALNLQNLIRSFGSYYTDAEVCAYNEREFDITFGGAASGENITEMKVQNGNFTSGYMAGAVVSTKSEAEAITAYSGTGNNKKAIGVTVSSDPYVTAANIKAAFTSLQNNEIYAPTSRTWYYDTVTHRYIYESTPSKALSASDAGIPLAEVIVTPVEGTNNQFYIQFTGQSGYSNQEELKLTSASYAVKSGGSYVYTELINEDGNYSGTFTAQTAEYQVGVKTIKECSEVFRVNAVESVQYVIDEDGEVVTDKDGDPIIYSDGRTDQFAPVVTLSNDGVFTIVWQSEIEDLTNAKNTYDIIGRRFSIQGVVDNSEITFYTNGTTNGLLAYDDPYVNPDASPVQGVRPLSDEYIVNVQTNGAQVKPAIDSDSYGNVTVTWTSEAADYSYFGGVYARSFDSDGLSLTGDVTVSTSSVGTPSYGESYVAVSSQGFKVVLYTYGTDLYRAVYAPDGSVITEPTQVASRAYGASVAFSDSVSVSNTVQYVMAYTQENEENGALPYTDVFGMIYSISPVEETPSEDSSTTVTTQKYVETAISETAFPVNNNGSGYRGETVRLDQGRVSTSMDAQGNVFFAYQGYGQDMQSSYLYNASSDNGLGSYIWLSWSDFYDNNLVYKDKAFKKNGKTSYESKNADLIDFVKGALDNIGDDDLIDVDTYIRYFLVYAEGQGATTDQLGRLNAVLETLLSPLRGAGNDILYTNMGQDAIQGATSGQDLNGIINGQRDGSNACFYLNIPAIYVSSGTVQVRIYLGDLYDHGNITNTDSFYVDVSVPLTVNPDTTIVNQGQFMRDLSDALNSLDVFNNNWNASFVVTRADTSAYAGTDWDPGFDDTFKYDMKYTIDDVEYTGIRTGYYFTVQIVAQNGAHDRPLGFGIYYGSGTATALALADQAADNDKSYLYDYAVERYGEFGTAQINAHVAARSNGSTIVTWAQQSRLDGIRTTYIPYENGTDVKSTQLYLRTFAESTDNAGPIVTAVSLPDGTQISDQDTVTSAVNSLVVSFDKEMMTTQMERYLGTGNTTLSHAVDSLSNWTLTFDGKEVSEAIESIYFGLNASQSLAANSVCGDVAEGALAYGTNRWEAIITFKEGYELKNGTYTLTCKSYVHDYAGNALYSEGKNYDGSSYTITFSVIPLNTPLAFEYTGSFTIDDYTGEVIVNESYLDQITRDQILEETTTDTPNNPTSVASDGNGNFVVAWNETNTDGSVSIYAKTYRQEYILDDVGTRTLITTDGKVLEIYHDETGTARQVSVAMDDLGEYVIVWDMISANSDDGSRDVFAVKHAFNGGRMEINGNSDTPTRVNIEALKDQQYAAIAMDSDGDFVIVWESYGQDGSGYGIYGRRFTSNGTSFGVANTKQTITFVDEIDSGKSTMCLEYVDENDVVYTSAPIVLSVEMSKNAERVTEAMTDLWVDENGNSATLFTSDDINIVASGSNRLIVEFKGDYAYKTVSPLEAVNSDLNISVATSIYGAEGTEFLVNDTTENNQRYASIGMNADGTFVVSWTSWGQDSDASDESNVYAKKYLSNHSLLVTSAYTAETLADDVESKVIVSDENINNYKVPSSDYQGVVKITIGDEEENADDEDVNLGSGVLLSTGLHILTAAHVIWDTEAGETVDPSTIHITFETANGTYIYGVSEVYVYPSYTGNTEKETDLAVLVLEAMAPSGVVGYDLYTDTNELGQEVTFVGYGLAGSAHDMDFLTGDVVVTRTAGTKHIGHNIYDVTGSVLGMNYYADTLIYDFDDGTLVNDYIGNNYGVSSRYLGYREAITAPGDSGSPTFIDGKVAGICSWGTDIKGDKSYGYGNIQVDVRVSSYAEWIQSLMVGGVGTEFLVNDEANTYGAVTVTSDDGDNNEGGTNATAYSTKWQGGNQLWSSVAIDGDGNFVITWTGYNQDGNGDAWTGGSNNGMGGVFARRFISNNAGTGIQGYDTFLVNNYTTNDQVHSQIAMNDTGEFVISWESYQDCSGPSGDPSQAYDYTNPYSWGENIPDSWGIYAKRYESAADYAKNNTGTDGTITLTDNGERGSEFSILEKSSFYGDQLCVGVAMNNTGDMIFSWTDLSDEKATLKYRTITLPEDTVSPYVTSVRAVYGELRDKVSLYDSNGVVFPKNNGPSSVTYTFSELMYTKEFAAYTSSLGSAYASQALFHDFLNQSFGSQDEAIQYALATGLIYKMDSTENSSKTSILNINNWTLMKDNVEITSTMIEAIYYGYNAGVVTGETESDYRSDRYELVILFKEPLPNGVYTLTLKDKTVDLSNNRLDGNYDFVAGGSFIVRFNVGITSATNTTGTDGDGSNYEPDNDEGYSSDNAWGHNDPAVVSFADGSFIIVATEEQYVLVSDSDNDDSSSSQTTGSTTTIKIDGDTYNVDSNVVIRRFNSSGNAIGTESVVNLYTDGYQANPDIDATSGGSYVVTWVGQTKNRLNGVAARFYPSGVAQGVQVDVNEKSNDICFDPQVVIDDDTGLVLITWVRKTLTANVADKVYGRFFNLYGKALSDVIEIAATDSFSVQSYDIETVNIDGTAQYIVTWAAGTSSDTNLFAKRFTVTDDYAITEQQSFMVSTEVGNQILPQIAVADNGDYYIAWSSNQNKNTSYDIYARGYTITGESKTLLGSTSEVQINTYALNIQTNPTIAVAPNGSGVVISWQSFDEEIDNVDMTVPGGQQLYDYGIVARVFNANGNPVNVVDASLSVGQEVDFGEGEFVVNSIVNGEQVTPAAGMSDWGYNLESSLYEPLFVVAWVGPGTMTQLDTETGGDSGDDADITIYSGEYQVFYKRYPAKSGTVTDDLITQKSYSSYVTDVSASSGIQGFYRPTDNGMALVSATENSTDEELYYVVGTTGDDVIEINIGSGRAKSSVTLNGENVAIPANATRIVVNAHAGNDKIVVNGRVTSAAVNATMNSLSIESDVFDVTVTGIENVVLAADSAESLTVQTTKSNDTVVIGPGSLELSGGNGFAVTATGFNSIAARSVTGSDIAILKDSEEDDTLTMQNGYAKITNGQYVNEAAGFSTVRAIASTGNDVAVLTEAQTLQAMLGSVIAKTSASVNIAMRFVTVDVTGTGAATIIGSMGGDALTCDGAGASLVYSDQTRISVNGFATINVDGNGGYDSAFVTGSNAGRNIFTGRQNIATMTNGRYSRTLRDFAHVEVFGSGDGNYEAVLYDTDADDVVTADKSSVRMSANGNEIYSVLAFDQVSVKKERYSGNDTVQAEETLDYLFASEGWNNE